MRLVRIVTHHRRRKEAARLFLEEGVAAMGWQVVGDIQGKSPDQIETILINQRQYSRNKAINARSQLLALRDRVKEGNIVFAYQCDNTVALVGKVTREYRFNDTNGLGDPEGDFKHPHQIEVDWRPRPRSFPRSYLPNLADWLATRGTIAFQDYDQSALERGLGRIP